LQDWGGRKARARQGAAAAALGQALGVLPDSSCHKRDLGTGQAGCTRPLNSCACVTRIHAAFCWPPGARLEWVIWLPSVAGNWCDVIAGTGYIKSANDESLARDEGGDWRRPQPVHGGCDVQNRTRASIAHDAGDDNIFSRLGCSCAQGPASSEGEPYEPTKFKLQ
jgi:hypothetical protein